MAKYKLVRHHYAKSNEAYETLRQFQYTHIEAVSILTGMPVEGMTEIQVRLAKECGFIFQKDDTNETLA